MGELPVLAELGVTVLEIMPIADFSGRFGWGYDGVNLFAPHAFMVPPMTAVALLIKRMLGLGNPRRSLQSPRTRR